MVNEYLYLIFQNFACLLLFLNYWIYLPAVILIDMSL